MRFSIFSTALVALTGSSSVATAFLTADEVATSIGTLTAKSQSLIEPAGTLSLANAAFLLLGEGPWAQVLDGLNDISETAKKEIVYMQTVEKSPAKFAGEEAQLIGDALKGLVKVVTELVDALVKQLEVVDKIPIIGQVVSPVLELVNTLLDNFLYQVVDLVEDVLAEALKLDFGNLDNTLAQAYNAF
ncbi:hypothetical protein QBC37DRAFT_401524 [Rhypophila decipiens]|uniref:Uncharacterized protein n=1 Tax=Rhypophila decipiens TaxID=261697 RepID=A0AAN6Y5V7_9PEZI|nr:hypothetical protein QBC37DRAFT_401524 [Rhypophila decipiens]